MGINDKYVKFISVFIGLLPILALFKIPGLNIGIGMFGLLILLPFILFLSGGRLNYQGIFFPLVFFICYMIMGSSSLKNYVSWLLVILWFLFARDIVDSKIVLKTVIIVASLASGLIILQTLFYYLLHFHLMITIPALLQDDLREQYSSLLSSGYITGMYRPSAFFLEPAHFGNYAAVGLIGCLLYDWNNSVDNRRCFNRAILLSLGIVFSTSGIGIVLCFVIWLLFFVVGRDRTIKLAITKTFLVEMTMGLIVCIIITQIPFVKNVLQRISGSGGGYNAIHGRLFYWDTYFTGLSTREWLLGRGVISEGKYMTGLMQMLYIGGLVLCALFYIMLLSEIRRKQKMNLIFAIMYGALIVFTGMVNTINMIFYILLIFIDYNCCKDLILEGEDKDNGLSY